MSVGQSDTCGTYVFDVKHLQKSMEFQDALLFSRQQLLQVVEKKGFNTLLLERHVFLSVVDQHDDNILTAGH